MPKKRILIADPDIEHYDSIKEDPFFKNIPLEFYSVLEDAQTAIRKNLELYALIIVAPEIAEPSGLPLIKFSLMYQPETPIYYLESIKSDVPLSVNFDNLGVQQILAKPLSAQLLIKLASPSLKFFDKESALKVSEQFKDKVGDENSDEDKSFRPVKSELFVSGKNSLFDLYVRMNKKKYIKILQAGDEFDPARLRSYIERNVHYFYIREEAQKPYLDYCDKITSSLTKKKGIGINQKFDFLLNQAELTLNTLSDLGVDNENIQYAQRYMKNVLVSVDHLGKENSFIQSLLAQLLKFEHSASVTIVAAIVAKGMGLENEKSLTTLGLAAFFHDIGLKKERDDAKIYEFHDESKAYLDEEEVLEKLADKNFTGSKRDKLQDLYFNHPEKGAELLLNVKEISPVVRQLISQHHSVQEKLEGRFFGRYVHPLASVLEISDRFVSTTKRFKAKKIDQAILAHTLLEKITAFPLKTQEAFIKTLLKRQQQDKAS